MAEIPCRKFTLADIMILVGLTAGGLAMARSTLESLNMTPWRAYTLGYGSPLLISWTLTLLTFRLRKPRPTLHRLFREPGAAASLTGSILIAIWTILCGFRALNNPGRQVWDLVAFVSLFVGPAVISIWAIAWITRTGHQEGCWIDRSGRIVGLGWIVLMVVVFIEIAR